MREEVITVIHTFGRDLKYNPHIHALVTEGAMDKDKNWKYVEYIPYNYLRKAWQKLLLDLLKSWFPEDEKVKRLIDQLYQRYPYGFYVHAEQRMKNARSAAKYIGRYLARPAIAEYRIVSYDGIYVHFWYEDHRSKKRVEVTLNAYRFIRLLIQHIPPKHFQLVGRFGLYSRRKNREAQKIVNVWNFMRTQQIEMVFERKQQKKSYRQRMIESFDRDPIQCPCCGQTMELVVIWHAKYGVLYHYEMQEELETLEDFLGLNEPDVLINFQCIDCGCMDPVPDFIVEECSYDLRPGEEVEMICPKCNGTMREKKSK